VFDRGLVPLGDQQADIHTCLPQHSSQQAAHTTRTHDANLHGTPFSMDI
jgi:hypothetical protein